MACLPNPDPARYTQTEWTGCAGFDALYPGPLLVPPPFPPPPPGVPPYPPPPPPARRYAVTTQTGCAGFDALYPGPNLGTAEAPIYRYKVTVQTSPACGDESVCCGCFCCMCYGYYPQFTFTAAGFTGLGNCATTDGDYVLTGGPGCLWSNTLVPPAPPPEGEAVALGDITPLALPDVFLTCEGETGWFLTLGGCVYQADPADFDCAAGGVMTLTTPGCCTTAPASITVSTAGDWVSCGQAEPTGPLAVRPAVAPTAPRRRPPPCVYRGPQPLADDELTEIEDRTGADLYRLRTWHRCGHPDKPLGEAVCGCRGCGTRCPGYAAPTDVEG
jgi:hypothetical protein